MSASISEQLIKAIWREDIRETKRLLDGGADLNTPGDNGFTPLMQAAEMENLPIAQLLLDRGADINRPGHHGTTPLHIAVDISIDSTIQCGGKQGEEPTEMINFLLARGASITAVDDKNETPLDWAKQYGSRKITNLLEARKIAS